MAETTQPVSPEQAQADAASVVGAIKEFIDPLLLDHEEALRGDDVAALIAAMRDLPPLPLAAEARAMTGTTHGYVANIELFPSTGSVGSDLHDIWGAATRGIGALAESRRSNAAVRLGTAAGDALLSKMLQTVGGGRYTTIADKLAERTDDPHEQYVNRMLTPLSLLQVALVAADDDIERHLTDEEQALSYYVRDDLIAERMDAIITTACRAITSGERMPSRNKSDSVAHQLMAGAFEALARTYRIGESERDQAAIIQPLMTLRAQFLVETRLGPQLRTDKILRVLGQVLNGQSTEVNLTDLVDKAAVRVQRELSAAGLDVPAEVIRAIQPPSMARLSDFQDFMDQGVDHAHTLLRMRAIARRLVDGIAAGDFGYARIQQIASQLYEKPLGDRSRDVALQRAIAQEQAAAAAREQEAAILARIESAADMLLWEVLPEGEHEHADGEQTDVTARAERQPREGGERKLEPYRMAGLLEIQAAWPYPGAQIFRSRLDDSGKRRKDGEEYYVLVLPEVRPDGTIYIHAVAECAAPDNALYLLRGDMDENADWNDVFSQTKTYALHKGAIWLRHPSKQRYEANPTETFMAFTDKVFEHLAMPVEKIWARWLGQAAISGTAQ